MQRSNVEDYRSLFLNDTPLLDVRAPIEFNQGAFPYSINLPLINDTERAAVGTCYKKEGQEAAIQLGHKLVSGEVKEQRLSAWRDFCQANPNGYLYCFRGGMRSKITQQWLKESGLDYPYVVGGYKALRRYLIDTIDRVSTYPMLVLSGNTGSGKTELIKTIRNGVDLEGAAHHRGSSFGRYVKQQQTQINFENQLAIQMLKRVDAGNQTLVYEDEGKMIGSDSLPLSLHLAMQQSEIVVIDDPLEVRLNRLLDEYIVKMQSAFIASYGEEKGWHQFEDYLYKGLHNIRHRLGSERHSQLTRDQKLAIEIMKTNGSVAHHLAWLTPLIESYYDPMYQYQLEKKSTRILFRGQYHDVHQWLINNS